MNRFIIDSNVLIDNLNKVRSMLRGNTKLCFMVKADAYGHTACRIAKMAEEVADYLGVACVSEGIRLRNANISTPILVVGGLDRSMVRQGIINDLTLSVSSLPECEYVCKVAEKLRIYTIIHIKINTGMNRYGLDDEGELRCILTRVEKSEYVHIEGVFSHIYQYVNRRSTMRQIRSFLKICKCLPKGVMRHILASGGLMCYPKYALDMVRVGYMAYGYMGDCRPIITIESNISEIRQINKGDRVGYDGTFVAKKRMTLATIPMGYADGLRLGLSNKGRVRIGEHYCQIVGKICMDCCMIDISGTGACVGDTVTILDGDNNALKHAEICNTSPYEILTGFKTNRMKIVVVK